MKFLIQKKFLLSMNRATFVGQAVPHVFTILCYLIFPLCRTMSHYSFLLPTSLYFCVFYNRILSSTHDKVLLNSGVSHQCVYTLRPSSVDCICSNILNKDFLRRFNGLFCKSNTYEVLDRSCRTGVEQ